MLLLSPLTRGRNNHRRFGLNIRSATGHSTTTRRQSQHLSPHLPALAIDDYLLALGSCRCRLLLLLLLLLVLCVLMLGHRLLLH